MYSPCQLPKLLFVHGVRQHFQQKNHTEEARMKFVEN